MLAVTGAQGMTGRHMLALLEAHGIPTKAIGRQEWDLSEWPSAEHFDALFADCDAIVHMAASVPAAASQSAHAKLQSTAQLFDANVRAVFALANWAAQHDKALIFISGSTVYAQPDALQIKEDAPKVISGLGGFYGYSKWLAESGLHHLMHNGLKCIILRPSSIYGSYMPAERQVAKFVAQAANDQTLSVMQPLENRINLIHSADIAAAALSAFQQQAWGIYNIAGPAGLRYLDIARAALSVTGRGNIEIQDEQSSVAAFNRFDLSFAHAHATFGYQPQVSLDDGIRAMHENQLLTVPLTTV